MKDWKGVVYAPLTDPVARDAVATINDFLYQLSPAIGRLGRGERPDSSGRPIVGLDDYFFLPGRPLNQTGYGGTAAGGFLKLASTRHTTKGKVYFGVAGTTAYDEANERLGIGTASPSSLLHVYGQPTEGATYTPASDCTGIIGDLWQANGAATWFSTLLTGVVGGGDDSLSTSAGGPPATTRNFGVVLDGALSPSVDSWTITYIARRSGAMFNVDTLTFRITRSDGTTQRSAPIYPYVDHTLAYVSYTAVVDNSSGAGGWVAGSGIREETPNSCAVTFSHTNGFPYSAIKYLRVSPTAGGSAGVPLTIVERTGSTSQSYSIWRDESDVTVASITSTGAGQFQNLVLEDPGAGTNTITHKAPTAPTTHSLVWPTVPIDAGFLKVSYSGTTGTLSWDTSPGPTQHRWVANGPYIVDTSVDGGYVAPTAITISAVWLHRTTAGSSSSTIVDLNKNGTTMYTTQANRPTIAFNDSDNKVQATLPDVVVVAAGDILTFDIDQIEAGNPSNLSLIIEGA